MKVIIIILQAILNLVRKRRDLIANRSKIPPEYRDDVVVWYSPKKQKLTNYDVIESYAEDFTNWTINNIAITSAEKKIVIPAGTELKYVIAFRGFNSFTAGFDIKYTGNAVIRYKYNKEDGTEDNITINKSGIYHLPARLAQPQQVNLWDEIDKEVCSLNNDQQAILAKDDVYNNVSAELQMLIQQELINSVRDKVANSPRGKELLEKQLNNIRAKKDSIIEEANKELELFKKFQIAAQANPKLTYVDFCNNIKNKEV